MKHKIEIDKTGIQERTACPHRSSFSGSCCGEGVTFRGLMIFAFWILVFVLPLQAEVSIANIFGSNGIIQCGRPTPIWGLADPGEKIRLNLRGIAGSQANQSHTTTADRLGKWVVTLDSLTAGDRFHLSVQGTDSKATSHHLQAGDIWIYIGGYRFRYTRLIPDVTEKKWEEENSDLFPRLRIYATSAKNEIPQRRENGRWKSPSLHNIFGFNPGIATHFGIDLCRARKIPVGIVHVASIYGHWIDEYLPAEKVLKDPVLAKTEDAKKLVYRISDSPEGRALSLQRIAYMESYVTESVKLNDEGKTVKHPEYPQAPEWTETKTSLLYNGSIHPLLPLAIKGVIVNDPDGQNPFDARNHSAKLEVLVQSFRDGFDDPALPIILIQPKADGQQNTVRFTTRYAAQQRLVQMDPKVALAVMHDIEVFEKSNELFLKTIPNKGHRVYQMADRLAYGNRSSTNAPPRIMSVSHGAGTMTLGFSAPLQTVDGRAPDGFALAAKGQNGYRPAKAKIEGNRIILSAPGIEEPEQATYGYLNAAIQEAANVVGKNGMPIAAFSTEILPHKESKY